MAFCCAKANLQTPTAQLGNSFAFLSRTSSTCRVFSKQPWFVFWGDSARCQVIYRKYLSDETFEGQEAANLQATTQTFMVSDSWIELKVLVIQNEFHFHVLVLVKGILGMTKKNHGGFLLHIFSWIFLGTTVMTQSQQQREICCFWATFQVSWVQNDHSYRPRFVMGFFCFSKSMRLLEPK